MNLETSTIEKSEDKPYLGSIPQQNELDVKESFSVQILKEKEGKKRIAVKLIEEGWSKNGYYYSPDVAESIADHIKTRPQMYMDHSFGIMAGRSFKDLAAIAVESYKKDGSAYAVVEMVDNPNTSWLWDLAKKFPGQVGASIDARAKVKEADETQEGKDGTGRRKFVVEEILFLNSVDFVTYPSAGGGVVELMASQFSDEATKKLSHLMEEFRSEVANLITQTEDTEMSEPKKVEMTKEALLADYPSIVEEIRKDLEADFEASSERDSREKELEAKVSDLEAKLEEANKVNDTISGELDEYKVKEKVATKKKMVQDAIDASGLDKEYVSEVFIDDLMKLDDVEDIQDRLKDRLALVESAAGEITGNGERAVSEDTDEPKEQTEEEAPVWDANEFVNSVKSYKTAF
ncbi:MAG: hypothetical protein VYD72_03250 [Chloroflexota bacterium]|nr:hypothetical protein [Chloroflexota bacterium]